MALNDIKVPKENAQGTFDEVALVAATTSADGLMSSADKTKLNGISSGAEVNVQANWTEADTGSDAFILNKPSTFAPSSHSSSHAVGGSDPLAPSDIGAQSIFSVESLVITTTSQVTLTAARAKIYDIVQYAGAAVDVKLPSTNAMQGDIVVLRWGTGSDSINVVNSSSPSVVATVSAGEQKRFIRGATDTWTLVPVDTHTHAASAITSGTLAHERGGLEADVSAYSGLVKISGGSTSAVTVTSAGEALLDDADAAAQRTTLGLGTAATAATGGFAASSHTHPASAISDSTTAGRALLTAADAAAQRTSLGLGTLATQSGTFSGTSSGTNTGDQTITLTGEVTGSGTGSFAATIANNAVTNAKLAQVATSTIKGRATAATGNVEDLTATQVRTILNVADGATANSSDATLLNRANHTGTQAASTITGLAASATTDTTNASNISSGTLGIARIPTGTTSSTVALGNHSHELTSLAATGATNGHVLTANGSGGVTFAAASGGIGGSTGATDRAILRASGTGGATAQNSALNVEDASTTTLNNVAITNQHSGQTNSALVLQPKGTGQFIVSTGRPDGTAAGGAPRGARAIDISLGSRSNANRVAVGTDSVLIGNDSATSNYGVSIGYQCVGGPTSTVIGDSNTAASDCVIVGSYVVQNTNLVRAVGIAPYGGVANDGTSVGYGASASATNAAAIGRSATASLRAQFATLPFSAVYWGGQTTTNAATILNLDGTATNRFTIAASTALAVDILLVARRATTQDKWLVARRFLGIRRDGSNNTSLIGTVQTLGTDQSAGSPTWTFALTADDTNEALQLEVTGATGETVEWRATAFYRVA